MYSFLQLLTRTFRHTNEIYNNLLFAAYFLKVCHRNDNDLNECVKRSIENLRPLMSKGIPEFDIPSCEPLIIPEVIIDQGNGPVSVKSTYNDVRVYGPTQFELKSIK